MPEPTALAALPRDLRLTRPAFFSTWLSERIRWSDTDQIGHVNNLSFSAYFESGRTEFLRDAIEANKASHAVLVVAQMNVCYLGELHWPGEVHIGTAMLEIGRSACRMGQGLFDGDRCVGIADTLLVLIDEAKRLPLPIPDAVRAGLLAGGHRSA